MTVLQRKELEQSPLADLHAIASELGLEGFRSKRKDDLIGAILEAQGGEADGEGGAGEAASGEAASGEAASGEAASGEAASGEVASAEDAPAEAASEAAAAETASGAAAAETAPSETSAEAASGEAAPDEPASREAAFAGETLDETEPDEVPSEESLEGPPAADEDEDDEDHPPEGELDVVEEEPEVEDEPSDEDILTGPLDILANGSGFLRLDPAGQSRGDVYVSPAQIRRCELRSGDEISGPVRPPRRNERHPSLIRVESVNGAPAEPPEQRPWFGELTPIFPTEPLGELRGVSYGKGARVAVVGPPGAGATTLLREAVAALGDDLFVQIALAGVRPEEIAAWRELGPPVAGGSFERSPEAQAQAAELAVERAKRVVERGGHAVVVVDALYALSPGTRRRVFGAGRATEEGGTLTVLAAGGDDRELLRWATARVELPPAT